MHESGENIGTERQEPLSPKINLVQRLIACLRRPPNQPQRTFALEEILDRLPPPQEEHYPRLMGQIFNYAEMFFLNKRTALNEVFRKKREEKKGKLVVIDIMSAGAFIDDLFLQGNLVNGDTGISIGLSGRTKRNKFITGDLMKPSTWDTLFKIGIQADLIFMRPIGAYFAIESILRHFTTNEKHEKEIITSFYIYLFTNVAKLLAPGGTAYIQLPPSLMNNSSFVNNLNRNLNQPNQAQNMENRRFICNDNVTTYSHGTGRTTVLKITHLGLSL